MHRCQQGVQSIHTERTYRVCIVYLGNAYLNDVDVDDGGAAFITMAWTCRKNPDVAREWTHAHKGHIGQSEVHHDGVVPLAYSQ